MQSLPIHGHSFFSKGTRNYSFGDLTPLFRKGQGEGVITRTKEKNDSSHKFLHASPRPEWRTVCIVARFHLQVFRRKLSFQCDFTFPTSNHYLCKKNLVKNIFNLDAFSELACRSGRKHYQQSFAYSLPTLKFTAFAVQTLVCEASHQLRLAPL